MDDAITTPEQLRLRLRSEDCRFCLRCRFAVCSFWDIRLMDSGSKITLLKSKF